MAYNHGVYISEQPTSIIPPRRVSAGLPVVIGSAPVNMTDDQPVNKPVLAYTYTEAVQSLGWSEDWAKFSLCEFMDAYFGKFAMAPVVFINVLDPAEHTASVADEAHTFADSQITLDNEGVLHGTVVVKSTDTEPVTHELDTDYTLGFDADGNTVITPPRIRSHCRRRGCDRGL